MYYTSIITPLQVRLEYVDGVDRGIDTLANAVESFRETNMINSEYYGNIHNKGHVIIAKMHREEGKWGVIGILGTAIRWGSLEAFGCP